MQSRMVINSLPEAEVLVPWDFRSEFTEYIWFISEADFTYICRLFIVLVTELYLYWLVAIGEFPEGESAHQYEYELLLRFFQLWNMFSVLERTYTFFAWNSIRLYLSCFFLYHYFLWLKFNWVIYCWYFFYIIISFTINNLQSLFFYNLIYYIIEMLSPSAQRYSYARESFIAEFYRHIGVRQTTRKIYKCRLHFYLHAITSYNWSFCLYLDFLIR